MMEWYAVLALSLPIGAGLALAGFWIAKAARYDRDEAWALVENEANRGEQIAKSLAKAIRYAADVFAESRVKAAKYQAGVIRGRPRPDAPETPTPFAKWMAVEGRFKPPHIQEACEAAFGYVSGEDSGSEMGDAGTAEGAKALLEEHAGPGWYAQAVEDAKARR